MALKQGLRTFTIVLALISFTGLIYEYWQWYQTALYNDAVEEGDFSQAAAQYKGPKGLFAKAFMEQQQSRFQQARVLYSSLEKQQQDASLKIDAMFNLANTYLEQAQAEDLEADRAMPLVELAKAGYRKLLAIDSQHWDAKYNLERALLILPDAGEFISNKAEGRLGTIRTVITGDTNENLP